MYKQVNYALVLFVRFRKTPVQFRKSRGIYEIEQTTRFTKPNKSQAMTAKTALCKGGFDFDSIF